MAFRAENWDEEDPLHTYEVDVGVGNCADFRIVISEIFEGIEGNLIFAFDLSEVLSAAFREETNDLGQYFGTITRREGWLRNADHLERSALMIRQAVSRDALFRETDK